MGVHELSLRFLRRARREPAWWAKEVLGVELWDGQIRMITSVRDHRKTAVKACHAPGKTFTAAVLVLWFLYNHPGSIVLTTAPTFNQVSNLLWREIRSLHHNSLVELGGVFTKDPLMLNLGEKHFAQGLSPNEPERFQGYHAPYVLIIVDEASGVDQRIMGAIEGIMMSGDVRLLMLSNPTKPEGTLYDAFNKHRSSHNPITLSAFDTPNLADLWTDFKSLDKISDKLALLRAAPIKNEHLVRASVVADILEQYGEDSQIWKVRVMAEFPDSSPDALIPLWHLERCVRQWEELPPELRWWERLQRWSHPVYGGFDPARFGDNKTSLCAQSQNIWAPFEVYDQTDTVFAAGRAAEFSQRHRCIELRVDEHGGGGGPLDLLNRNRRVNSIGVHVGSRNVSDSRYYNKRAETYFQIRELARQGQLWIPNNQRLIGQLSTIKYKYAANGALLIESKEDMRARGVQSPDEADALMLSKVQLGSQVAGRAVGNLPNFEGMIG